MICKPVQWMALVWVVARIGECQATNSNSFDRSRNNKFINSDTWEYSARSTPNTSVDRELAHGKRQIYHRGGSNGVAVRSPPNNHYRHVSTQSKPPSAPLPSKSISDTYNDIRKRRKALRRKEIVMLTLARIAFVLGIPLSLIPFVLTATVSLVLFILKMISFGFVGSNLAKISICLLRINISFIMACITGLINPYFAIFGLVAAVGINTVEMTEPILRIRFAKEVRKLKHLHKLISDPVLVETISVIIKQAHHASSFVTSKVESTASKGKRRLTGFGRAQVKRIEDMDTSASYIVETLIDSSVAADFQSKLEAKLPPAIMKWARLQLSQLRSSGILESAAKQALCSLQEDLSSAKTILPYLEALQEVGRRQKC